MKKQKNLTYKGIQLKHGMLFRAMFAGSIIKGRFNLVYRYGEDVYLLICTNHKDLNGGHGSAERFGYKYGYVLTIRRDGDKIINFGNVISDVELIIDSEPDIDYEIFGS